MNSASRLFFFFTILRGMFFPRDESFRLFFCAYFAINNRLASFNSLNVIIIIFTE